MTYMRCVIYLITVVGFKFKGHLRIICLLWKAYNVWLKGSYIYTNYLKNPVYLVLDKTGYKLAQKPIIFLFFGTKRSFPIYC